MAETKRLMEETGQLKEDILPDMPQDDTPMIDKRSLEPEDVVRYVSEYLETPVAFETTLVKHESMRHSEYHRYVMADGRKYHFVDSLSGRYATADDRCIYTRGSIIEFLHEGENCIPDSDGTGCVPYWRISVVERGDEGHYIAGFPSVVLDGLKIRIRKGWENRLLHQGILSEDELKRAKSRIAVLSQVRMQYGSDSVGKEEIRRIQEMVEGDGLPCEWFNP